MRVFLEFGQAWCVELLGEVIDIGRSSKCTVQLPDDAMSRRHIRVRIDRRSGKVSVRDLGSTNGTRLNGTALTAAAPLLDGDLLQLGHTMCRARVLADHDPLARELARRQYDLTGESSDLPTPCTKPGPVEAATDKERLWGFVSSLRNDPRERRRDFRLPTTVRVRYEDNYRRFTTTTHDLSLGGAFIVSQVSPSELADSCTLTLLPDDAPPMTITGTVRHNIATTTTDGHPPGLGIEFTGMHKDTWCWLECSLIPVQASIFADSSPDRS
jgi:hypothetical protein